MRKTALGITLALLFLAAACLTLPLPVDAAPRTIVVPDDAQTITAALGYALNGDTILVKAGTYQEGSLLIDKPILLVGETAGNTIINDTDPHFLDLGGVIPRESVNIEITVSGVRISNLTLIGGANGIVGTGDIIQIVNCTVVSAFCGIRIEGFNQTIAENTISGGSGIECVGSFANITANRIEGAYNLGVKLEGSYSIISGNAITNGLSVTGERNAVTFNNVTGGIYLGEGSSNNVYANIVSGGGSGLSTGAGKSNVFAANTVVNCWNGIESYGGENRIFHNNFINNTSQFWAGFPRGEFVADYFDNGREGNYWSDYKGIDANNDGIGDTPYVIDATRKDNYPLMFPWGSWDIQLSSPVNQSYSVSVPLVFVADRPAEWFGYSLDGKENVTIAGNTTLSGLSEGWHTLTVYANDTLGNAANPVTRSFFVDTKTALFQTLLIAVSVAVVAVVVGAGLLIYNRKRRREAEKA